MILYNVTVGIDSDAEQEWLEWMKKVHIPKVMATGMFQRYDMYKVLSQEGEGASYSIQYISDSMEKVEQYLNDFAPALVKEHLERYRNKHVAFRTLLEKVG
ncbi:MAG: DUF4286 family protein [Bacteroidetes bacterium]|nr:DUF4286 family protein [Bacteroidota bacterium]MCH8231853.1 DUF4286 family protein [Bacteroidota bacterium]